MIKVDLHTHAGEDPKDGLAYPATALIDKASSLGFDALAVTLHGAVIEDERVYEYARGKGVLLVRGAEWKSPHGDVLLCNVSQADCDRLRTLEDLRALRRERGDDVLIVAPHPYFFKHSLHRWFERYIDVFDAVEYAHLHLPWLNLNRKAVRVASRHGKPMIATSDSHGLWMLGKHYTLVDAEPTVASLFAAIRAGRVERVSPPVNIAHFVKLFITDPLFHRKEGRIIRSFD
jgi:predicted metal-dependent phosphoesterase TrpH